MSKGGERELSESGRKVEQKTERPFRRSSCSSSSPSTPICLDPACHSLSHSDRRSPPSLPPFSPRSPSPSVPHSEPSSSSPLLPPTPDPTAQAPPQSLLPLFQLPLSPPQLARVPPRPRFDPPPPKRSRQAGWRPPLLAQRRVSTRMNCRLVTSASSTSPLPYV